MFISIRQILPLAPYCLLLAIALMGYSSAQADGQWRISADVQSFSLEHTERYQNQTRNRERGSITIHSLSLGYSIDRLELNAFYSFGDSRNVDYTGLSIQTERPLTGQSNYSTNQLGGSIAYWIDLSDTIYIAPYFGLSSTSTRREIIAGSTLNEKYRWLELEAGFDGYINLSNSSHIGMKAALLSTSNGHLTADLISAGYTDDADISLGSGNGYILSLYYEKNFAQGVRFRFGPTIKKWTIPESRGNTIFNNSDPNTELVTISPESDTSYRGFDFKIDYSF